MLLRMQTELFMCVTVLLSNFFSMTLYDIYNETMTSIQANRARTGLTVLGIVIGIASVIVMLAIGNGAQSSITSSISSLGSNILTITGGGGSRQSGGVNMGRSNQQTLTLDDAKAIEDKLDIVEYVSPELNSRAQVVAEGNNTNTSIIGVVPDYEPARAVTLEDGSFITDAQYRSGAKVAILGPTTRNDLFGVGGDAIGKEVRIGSTRFIVIGVTASKGGSSFGNADDRIYIPLTTSLRYLAGGEYVSSIAITTANQSDIAEMQAQVTALLLERHNKKTEAEADFSIFNQADLASTAQSITKIFTILLSSVASISLLVGGIGIMNMMLTNVRERTREIGLRKAVGAKKKDISNQFLAESIVITILGGIIGVFFGVVVAYGITSLGVLETKVTTGPVLLAFGVSAFIGIVFGYYPAKKASELNPIEALRYE
jgi:putative ABC transport system permease protein